MAKEVEKVGGGSIDYDVYRVKEKKTDWGTVAAIVFWMAVAGVILATCAS